MLCAGLQMRPDVLLLWGPCLHQGENGLPDFTEAAAQRAADMNLLRSFLPDPHCFLGLPRELRARAEPPGPLSSLEVGRIPASAITPIPPLSLTGESRIPSAKKKHENTNPRGSKQGENTHGVTALTYLEILGKDGGS